MNSNVNHWSPNSYDLYQPFYNQQQQHMSRNHQLKHQTLSTVEPLVQYGLKEAQVTSYLHAMREVAAVSYLIGKGYDPRMAYQMVESWEVAEMFYPR